MPRRHLPQASSRNQASNKIIGTKNQADRNKETRAIHRKYQESECARIGIRHRHQKYRKIMSTAGSHIDQDSIAHRAKSRHRKSATASARKQPWHYHQTLPRARAGIKSIACAHHQHQTSIFAQNINEKYQANNQASTSHRIKIVCASGRQQAAAGALRASKSAPSIFFDARGICAHEHHQNETTIDKIAAHNSIASGIIRHHQAHHQQNRKIKR